MSTKIEYVDESINPIRTKEGGWYCEKISPGCRECYAERINLRFGDKKCYIKRDVELVLNQKALDKLSQWKKPKKIFVQDMSDLFHKDIKYEWFKKIMGVIELCPQHTFTMLTKRPNIAWKTINKWDCESVKLSSLPGSMSRGNKQFQTFKNIKLGVSVENQEQADKRIPILLKIPAAVRFVSVEPMLGGVNLRHYSESFASPGLDWVIIGAESGPKARKINNTHIIDLLLQCSDASVPVFLKQAWINNKLIKMPDLGGQVWDQMPV